MSIEIPQSILRALVDVKAAHYVTVSGATVLFYDYLLCFPDEVAYIWPSSFSLPIVLYYVVRYLPIAWMSIGLYHLSFTTTDEFCRGYSTGQLVAQALTYIPATWLLSIRVLALYPGCKRLRFVVYTFLALTHISSLSVACTAYGHVFSSIIYSELMRDCMGKAPRQVGIAMLLLIPLETLLVALQLYHNFLQRKIFKRATLFSIHLLSTLYMDGAIFFLVVFSTRLWTGLMEVAGPATLFYLSIFLEYSLTSTSICRLFIHLRKVAQQTDWDQKNGILSEKTTGRICDLELRIIRRQSEAKQTETPLDIIGDLPTIERTSVNVPLFHS